jgi:IclR family acetate operon transcriptional repressor
MARSVPPEIPETSSTVRAVERALQLIEVFARSRGPLAISELAAKVGLPPSTVHRLVQTLMSLGYVVQYQQSKRYGVGRGIAEINRAMLLKYEFGRFARPYLEALVEATGETASLAALYGTSVIYVSQVESPAMVRVSNPVGTPVPLHCTAVGKVFLADFRPDMLEETLAYAGLTPSTSYTLTTREALERELEGIRRQGYALDDQEYAEGVRCLAVGLRGSSGAVVAALSVCGPLSRMSDGRLSELARLVVEIADRFAQRMREP